MNGFRVEFLSRWLAVCEKLARSPARRMPTNISLVIKIHTYNTDQVCNWLRGRLHKRSSRDLEPSVHKECSLIRVTLLSADHRCILLRSCPGHGRLNFTVGKLRAKILASREILTAQDQGREYR